MLMDCEPVNNSNAVALSNRGKSENPISRLLAHIPVNQSFVVLSVGADGIDQKFAVLNAVAPTGADSH
jgi:hypothetical protein